MALTVLNLILISITISSFANPFMLREVTLGGINHPLLSVLLKLEGTIFPFHPNNIVYYLLYI